MQLMTESLWTAVMWGALSSGALFIGQLLAGPMKDAKRATGLIAAFGAGTLLSAVAYELIPDSALDYSLGFAFVLGALTYYFADRLIDSRGGKSRRLMGEKSDDDSESSGLAMFLGALLDGIPESFILGMSLGLGGGIGLAFVAAVFLSNIPEGITGTISMKAAGYSNLHVLFMWSGLMVTCAVVAGLGFTFADSIKDGGINAQAFAAGAVLTMLADSMMPQAFKNGGRAVGLVTVIGYATAAALTMLD